MRLIEAIKGKAPKSIYESPKALKRDFKNAYQGVLFLAEIGILGLTEARNGRRQKKPSLLCDEILFQIAA